MRRIEIPTDPPYSVLMGAGLISEAGPRIRACHAPCTTAIISDDVVAALYGADLQKSLQDAGFKPALFAFPHGEQHKNLDTLSRILEWMGEIRLSRGDIVIALGGGVTGDMGGFAAAVYARGIPFVQIPTTLLAAVDASVGGKTAVDLRTGKNLAGAFHQPLLVLCDTAILSDLPETLVRDGAAEMIKCGVLADPELLERLADGSWRDNGEDAVARCVEIKRDYVAGDERDQGKRQYLNLGHTFGHAVEVCSNYSISHGCAVGMGLMMAARAAGMNPAPIQAALEAFSLPTQAPYSAQQLAAAALGDKKRRGDTITLVLPEAIGRCRLQCIPISRLPDYFSRGMNG